MSIDAVPLQASVIIPVWNGLADLQTCLAAVFEQTDVTFEVIAVDDASTDGSAMYIAEHFPRVRLLRAEANAGFSVTCNVGLRHAQGEVLVFLNQDTEVKEGWLSALVDTLTGDPQIGIVGSKALYADGTIQHVGGKIDDRGNGAHIGHKSEDAGQYEQRRDVDYVTGASLAISRKAYIECGGFDENFGISYYEDVDLCYRVRHAGYRVVYEPQSVLMHNERSVSADGSVDSNSRTQRNRLRFVLKNWSTDRLLDEFVPLEQSWLTSLDPNSIIVVNALRRAYLRLMMTATELSSYRRKRFGDSSDVFQIAQSLWVSLETHERLRSVAYQPSNLYQHSPHTQAPVRMGLAVSSNIERIRQNHPVRPQPFHSNVPLLGPLIARFRQRWNRISAEWFVLPIISQQNDVNEQIIQTLERIASEQANTVYLQSAYITEMTEQISKLEETVQQLREQANPQNGAPEQE